MNSQGSGVDHTLQHDVQHLGVWFDQISIGICLNSQVVGTRSNASIGKYTVDTTEVLLGCLEQSTEFFEDGDIGLDE